LLDLSVIRRLRDFTLSIDLAVRPGEILLLTGRNGSGKSTALHLIAGLMKPESGYVRCQGTVLFDRESGTDIPTEERRIGYIFQNAVVFPHLTVYDNIAYGCRARGIDPAATARIVKKLLNRLAIGHLSEIKAGQLSGGQRQMVVLARALAIEPILLLLDEPFRALDGDSNLLVNRSIENEVKRSGIPCILVTHNPEEVRIDFCRTCRMEKGRIIDR